MKTPARHSNINKTTIAWATRLTAILITTTWLGCGAPTPGSTTAASSLAVSGSLSLSSSAQSMSVGAMSEEAVSAMATDLTLYTVKCATTTTPILYGSSAIAANGSFSVSIIGGTGQPLSCYLVTAAGVRAADFIISDASKTDLNGASQVSGTATFSSNADMGAITFDPNSGEVTVPAANIAGVVDTAVVTGVVFDPSGTWTIGAVDFVLPPGVKGPVAASCATGGGEGCNGPPSGQAIFMQLWKGLKISDSSDNYSLQLWNSATAASSCGNKIGLTPAIKTAIGVNFGANGAADDEFTLANSVANFNDQITNVTGTVNLTDGWKMNTATSRYDIISSCGPRNVTIAGITYSNAWVCGPDASLDYQVQLGGGCVNTATSAPVQVNNWVGFTCNTATDTAGIKTSTCSGTTSINSVSTAVTCTNKYAVTNSTYVVNPSGNFNWSELSASKIASGTLCSDAAFTGSEAKLIAQNQCYANYYWQSGFERVGSTCLPKIDMDWSATTAAAFVKVDKIRPNGLVFFEQFKPFSDGSGGTMVTRQEHYDGVNVNGNSWVNCKVIDTGGFTIKKISATKLLATYQSSRVTTSLTKPACLAKFNGARETFVFYITK